MNQIIKHAKVQNPQGIHARPAAQIVRTLEQFSAQVWIERPPHKVSARSILELLTLSASHGTELIIYADGTDAEAAAAEICFLIEGTRL